MENVNLNTSTQYYDALAYSYSREAEKRLKYNLAINEWIRNSLKIQTCANLLDVGTGDGTRLFNILHDVRYLSLNIVEPSEKLISMARSFFPKANFYNRNLQECDLSENSFSHVLALWNVLGHVSNRLEFVAKILQLLEPSGYFIFDVNNRYNIKQYGLISVARNFVKDLFNKADSGYFILRTGENSTKVFIHSKRDVMALMKIIGFEVTKIYYVDYENGCFKYSQFSGQMLIVARKSS